jgi:hypothetical protein
MVSKLTSSSEACKFIRSIIAHLSADKCSNMS